MEIIRIKLRIFAKPKDTFPKKSESIDEHADSTMKTYGNGRPIRLFVAGLHGEEWKDTTGILKAIKAPKAGTLVNISCKQWELHLNP